MIVSKGEGKREREWNEGDYLENELLELWTNCKNPKGMGTFQWLECDKLTEMIR